jgi:branched-chain amino acid transport system ATP-binding protein
MSSTLTVRSVGHSFGGLTALSDVTLDVEAGSVTGLIGPNGAGKSTLFRVIGGSIKPDTGQVLLDGEDITREAPHEVAMRGLMRTFQVSRPLKELSVLDNVRAGTFRVGRSGALGVLFGLRSARREEAESTRRAMAALDELGLADRADAFPGQLTGGQLRMLEIARVLAAQPRVLMLDEPAAGLTRTETDALEAVLVGLRSRGLTCVLIEHDVELVFRLCDHVTVLQSGRVVASGPPEDVRADPTVRAAYLGTSRKQG